MQRRFFIKTAVYGSLAMSLSSFTRKEKSHVLSLSFDDGFRKSFYKIADIHEEYGLKACLNVIASGHLPSFKSPDKYQKVPLGDFNDWNVLKGRGHEIMPHSWDHSNLKDMPTEKAKEDIDKCLNYFTENLDGFKASESVYNFAFNASTPELEEYCLDKVLAIRTYTGSALNPVPSTSDGNRRVGCLSHGPENSDHWVEQMITEFMAGPGGWLVLNLHGLDDESWGPLSSVYLDKLLKSLVKLDFLDVLPVGEVVKQYSEG